MLHDVALLTVDDLHRIKMSPYRRLADRLITPLGVRPDRYDDLVRVLYITVSVMPFPSPFDAIQTLMERFVIKE